MKNLLLTLALLALCALSANAESFPFPLVIAPALSNPPTPLSQLTVPTLQPSLPTLLTPTVAPAPGAVRAVAQRAQPVSPIAR